MSGCCTAMTEDEELEAAKEALKQAMADGDKAAMDVATREIARIKNFQADPYLITGWTKPAKSSTL